MMVVLFISLAIFSACSKYKTAEPNLPKPTATNVEIGTNNNKRGIIGADFHLNADILAGHKIALVKVLITQKAGETYTAPWKFELAWESYKDAKNTNVHRHFDIPKDAPKGKYDFSLIVTDQNGTQLVIKEDFNIMAQSDLPFNPAFSLRTVPEENKVYKKGEVLTARFTVNDVQGEGTLCAVLIKESAKHYPETVAHIDFSKAIVIGRFVSNESPSWGMFNTITIGADRDSNSPEPSAITGLKKWESGKYNFVLIYENKLHNLSLHKSIPIVIDYQ